MQLGEKLAIETNKVVLSHGEVVEFNFTRNADVIQGVISSSYSKLKMRPEVVVFGKRCRQPRDVGFFSNESKGYRYSGRLMPSQSLTNDMETLVKDVNVQFGQSFNGLLVNRYSDGMDCIGAHSDDEAGLNQWGVLSISTGAVRTFRIRDKLNKSILCDFPTRHLHGILMQGGDFQRMYTHEVPVQTRVKEERVSITFRCHIE